MIFSYIVTVNFVSELIKNKQKQIFFLNNIIYILIMFSSLPFSSIIINIMRVKQSRKQIQVFKYTLNVILTLLYTLLYS